MLGGDPKFVVGIDLGTTNSAVAYADAAGATRVRIFDVPQLVAPGELAARPTLPSFVYLAGEHDLPEAATRLPWDPAARVVVGELARAQGARVPGRMIASAKSWLCHAGVDRHAAILPWGGDAGEKLSPVDASARVLAHVAHAWQHAMGCALADQDVVVTVPASFDEVARELTIEAATKAGLPRVTLIEEPQAVFYAWMDAHPARVRRDVLHAGETVLVCDVGGGTTDFTLIQVAAEGDGAQFERTAVGDHLLLGGDNVDIALARRVETRLGKLDAMQWHGLVHACRMAKEQLFTDPSLEKRAVTVAGRGSRLIGATLKDEITREEVATLVLDGFFPLVDAAERPARGRVGLAEFGLPYAADAAVTRHLAAFLARHGANRVDAVVFNGGAMKPPTVRARVLDQIAAWQLASGMRPRELENASLDLAVAHGAACYGLVRRGFGERITGGSARAYYVGVDAGGKKLAVCVTPRGVEEGTERELAHEFSLVMNRPVSFRLYSATARDEDTGAVIDAEADGLVELPPLVTVLRAPGRGEARVRIRARLTELGTLELWCVDAADAEGVGGVAGAVGAAARWRLAFELRGDGGQREPEVGDAAPVALDPRVEPARAALAAAFTDGARPEQAAQIMKELERILDARRDEWGTATIRALWDALNEHEPARSKSGETEARWLNLAGFLLRPGSGAPLDDWRTREMWKVFNVGLRHDRDEACRLGWWIVWRRIAGGLKRGQQEQIYDRVMGLFFPGAQQKQKKFKIKPSAQETAEIWRTVASMERLPAASKVRLGDALLERLEQGRDVEIGPWALGRLGARAPLYGPLDAVVPAETATRWIERLLALDWAQPEKIAFPAAQLGRRTGDRARDIDDELRARLAARLKAIPGSERTARLVEEVVALEAREERVAFGDSLPTGLKWAGVPAE